MLTVFGKKNCQPCRMTTRWLDNKEVPYNYVSVEDSQEAADEVRKLGYTSLPVVRRSPDVHWSGFRPDLLQENFT